MLRCNQAMSRVETAIESGEYHLKLPADWALDIVHSDNIEVTAESAGNKLAISKLVRIFD